MAPPGGGLLTLFCHCSARHIVRFVDGEATLYTQSGFVRENWTCFLQEDEKGRKFGSSIIRWYGHCWRGLSSKTCAGSRSRYV